MKKIVFLFLFFLITVGYAQDSLNVKTNGHTLFYKNVLDYIKNNPFNYNTFSVKNYTSVNLGYDYSNLKFKKVLEPEKTSNFIIDVNGLYKHKKSTFSGKINYTKNNIKQLGWNLSNMIPYKEEIEKSPFYFVAYRPGDWQNQYYTLNGAFTTSIIENKLKSLVEVDYNTFQLYRTKEPLPKLTYLDLTLKGGLLYVLNSSNNLGFKVNWGYLHNEIAITYTGSSSDKNIPINADIYNRLSVGYGFIESAKTLRGKEREGHKGLTLFHNYFNDNLNVSTEFNYQNSKNNFYEVYSNVHQKLGHYKLDKFEAKILGLLQNNQVKQVFKFSGKYYDGSNFRNIFSGTNYKVNQTKLAFSYNRLKKQNGIINSDFFTEITYNNLNQKDYQVTATNKFADIVIDFSFLKEFDALKSSIVWGKFGVQQSFTLTNNIQYSGNTNQAFIENQMQPDYVYNSANKLFLKPEVGIKFNNVKAGIYFNKAFYFNVDDSKYNVNHTTRSHNFDLGMFLNFTY